MIRYSVAVGYDFYPQFSIPIRTELEFYARGKADSKYNVDKDSWSGGYWRDDLKNEVSVNTLMLNAYYDFRNDSAFTPWVSAGIGYARIHQKTTGISTWDYEYGSSGRESLSRSGSADNFAWSLGAGVRYDVTPDIALDLRNTLQSITAGLSVICFTDNSDFYYPVLFIIMLSIYSDEYQKTVLSGKHPPDFIVFILFCCFCNNHNCMRIH